MVVISSFLAPARIAIRTCLKMMLSRLSLLAATGLLHGLAYAQFPPALEGVTVLDSHIEDGINISYKEVCRHIACSIFQDTDYC